MHVTTHTAKPAYIPPVDREVILLDFVIDLADHGLRADLMPTIDWTSVETAVSSYNEYLARLDATIRERAHNILHNVGM